MKVEHAPRGFLALVAFAGIALQFSGSLMYSSLALAVWMVALWIFNPCVLRRMWMPRFWTITLVVALGSGLLIGAHDEVFLGIPISTLGLYAGALMVIRGAFIFALAGWASKALANSGLDRLASRFGAQNLAISAGVALDLLPGLSDRIQGARHAKANVQRRGRWKSAYLSAVNLLADCAMMADNMAKEGRGPSLVIITGPIGAGKTHTAKVLAHKIKSLGVSVGGVIQPRHEDGESYLLEDVATGRRWRFASFDPHRPEGKTGYRFFEQGWTIAASRLQWAALHMSVVMLDEVGLLEADGKGHWSAFRHGFDNGSARLWVLVVRKDRLESFIPRLGRIESIIDVGEPVDVEDLASSLVELVDRSKVETKE